MSRVSKKTAVLRTALDKVPLHELHAAINRRKEQVSELAEKARSEAERASFCCRPEGEEFLAFCVKALGLSKPDLLSVRRHEPLLSARHTAMAVAREVLGWSLQDLALLFGRPGKQGTGDHSGVIYAVNRVRATAHLQTQADALRSLWEEAITKKGRTGAPSMR